MIIQHIDADNLEAKVLLLGKQGENNSHQIVFDYSGWLDFGNGSFILIHQRSGDSEPAPVFVEFENGTATWTVTETDVAHAGRGKAEIKYVVNDKVVKSRTYTTRVVKSLEEIENPSEPWKNWLEQTVEAVDELMENVNEQFAEEKAERSTAFTTEQSDRAQAFSTEQLNRATAFNEAQATRETAFNSNISAWGARIDNAVSEAEAVTANANSATASANTASAKADQSANNADTATVNANEATARANAISENLEAKVASDYYRGAKGDKGDKGDRGLQGVKGDPGYTPQRGVDYWTAEDEAKITEDLQADVDQATADVHAKVDNLRKQVQQNTQRIEIAEAVLSQGDFGWKLETEDSYEHFVPANAVTVRDESYSFADVVGIGGNTVVWNQLIQPNKVRETRTVDGLSFVKNSDGSFTISGTPTLTDKLGTVSGITLESTHKYYIPEWSYDGGIKTGLTATQIRFAYTNGVAVSGTYYPRIFDLTKLYGSGNEPTDLTDPRIKWLKAYAELHPEYNAGELVSAKVESVESLGKNLFDVNASGAERGQYNPNDVWSNSNTRVTTPFIPVSGGTYSISVNSDKLALINFNYFDDKKTWLGNRSTLGIASFNGLQVVNGFTLPDTAKYLRITVRDKANTDAVITIDDYKACKLQLERGTTATEYSPYGSKGSFSIPEQLQDLKRAGTAYDSLDFYADKWIERVGVVDLGTLDYVYQSGKQFRTVIPDKKIPTSSVDRISGLLCPIYTPDNSPILGTNVDMTMAGFIGNGNVYFYNFAYTNASDFKQAMQGVLLYYELAEPIEHDIKDLVDKSFLQAEPNGVIRFNSDTKLPVHNAISFPVNNRQALGV